MIAIIAGGRDRDFLLDDILWLDDQRGKLDFESVVHGDYGKTDKGADRWARFHGLAVTPFPPDTSLYGPWPGTGPRRNQAMVDYAKESCEETVLITFPGGRGTADIIRRAKKVGMRHIERVPS